MAQCVVLNPDGTLTPTAEPVAECSGFVLVSGSEFSVYQLVHEAFATPTSEQTATLLSIGFFGPLAVYMVAHLAKRLASMFDRA